MPNQGAQFKGLAIDKRLSNFAIGYRQTASLVSSLVAPEIFVTDQSGKFKVFDRKAFTQQDDIRTPGTMGNQVAKRGVTDSLYFCENHSLFDDITIEDRSNADEGIDLETQSVETIMDLINLKRESECATLVQTLANWANGVTLAGVDQWNNAAFAGSIESDIDTQSEAIRLEIGMNPNVIVIPAGVAKIVKKDPGVRALRKATDDSLLVNGDLPPVLWNMKVIIPGAVNSSAALGQPYVGADVWGKHVTLMFVNPKPSRTVPTATKTFIWKPAGIQTPVENYWKQDIKADIIRVGEYRDQQITSSFAGAVIRDAIS